MEWPGFQRSHAELIEDPQEAWAALLVLRRECHSNVFGKSRTRAPGAGATPSSGVTRAVGRPAYQITNGSPATASCTRREMSMHIVIANGLRTSLPSSPFSHQGINHFRAAANGYQPLFTCQAVYPHSKSHQDRIQTQSQSGNSCQLLAS